MKFTETKSGDVGYKDYTGSIELAPGISIEVVVSKCIPDGNAYMVVCGRVPGEKSDDAQTFNLSTAQADAIIAGK